MGPLSSTRVRGKLTLRLGVHSPGQSGTGRTTFVNTLCESEVLSHKDLAEPARAHEEDGIKIKPFRCVSLGRKPLEAGMSLCGRMLGARLGALTIVPPRLVSVRFKMALGGRRNVVRRWWRAGADAFCGACRA